jgi:hypothetical protein
MGRLGGLVAHDCLRQSRKSPPKQTRLGRGLGGASGKCSGQSPPQLLLEHFLDLPDFLFDFAGRVLGFAFILQVGIIRDFAHRLFDFAFYFMKSAFNFIRQTRAHWFSPYG